MGSGTVLPPPSTLVQLFSLVVIGGGRVWSSGVWLCCACTLPPSRYCCILLWALVYVSVLRYTPSFRVRGACIMFRWCSWGICPSRDRGLGLLFPPLTTWSRSLRCLAAVIVAFGFSSSTLLSS